MLEPEFFQVPEDIRPLAEGARFEIRWYAKYMEFTLVAWRLYGEVQEEFQEGQALYRGRQAIAWAGGAMFFVEEETRASAKPYMPPSFALDPWDGVDKLAGEYGLSEAGKRSLLSLENRVTFIPYS